MAVRAGPAAEKDVETEEVDFISVYAQQLCDIICREIDHPDAYDTPLSGFKIIVDAGNGAGGFFVEK